MHPQTSHRRLRSVELLLGFFCTTFNRVFNTIFDCLDSFFSGIVHFCVLLLSQNLLCLVSLIGVVSHTVDSFVYHRAGILQSHFHLQTK